METIIASAMIYFCTCMAADAEFQDQGVMAWSWQPDRSINAAIWPVLVLAWGYWRFLCWILDD